MTVVDGTDYADSFAAFIHAPFKDDCAGERNDTSLALQLTFSKGTARGRALLLGDLRYPTVQKIFEITLKDEFLAWDVFQAPHHCSKSVMYWQDEDEDEPTLKQDLLDRIEGSATPGAYIVASCEPIPATNKPGDNPPHAKAKAAYQSIVDSDHFLCTQEHGGEASPVPITFRFGDSGLEYEPAAANVTVAAKSLNGSLTAASAAARGGAQTPQKPTGYGA